MSASEAVSIAAEKRWALIVVAIIGFLVLMMVITGLHWASMPPSRVETVDVRTVHTQGEFVESNLGTTMTPDGKVTVRLVAQQYSFVPQCIVVPAGMPVTFRGTATDAIHGFIVGRTNANTMLVPGFVAAFTTTFPHPGEQLMPVPRILRHRPRGDVGARAGAAAGGIPRQGQTRREAQLCSSLDDSCWRISGWRSSPSSARSCSAPGRRTCAARFPPGSTTRSTTTAP